MRPLLYLLSIDFSVCLKGERETERERERDSRLAPRHCRFCRAFFRKGGERERWQVGASASPFMQGMYWYYTPWHQKLVHCGQLVFFSWVKEIIISNPSGALTISGLYCLQSVTLASGTTFTCLAYTFFFSYVKCGCYPNIVW